MKVIPLKVIRERESDPDLHARALKRSDAIEAKLQPFLPQIERLADRAYRDPLPRKKIRFIREAVSYLERAAQAHAPCKDRCAQCCHIPVMVSQTEMDVIAEETGRRFRKPERYVLTGKMEYTGSRCPMLNAQDRCSIYEHRPIACRVHYVMDRDNTLCQVHPGEGIMQPLFNNMRFLQMLVQAIGMDRAGKQADIRDFLP